MIFERNNNNRLLVKEYSIQAMKEEPEIIGKYEKENSGEKIKYKCTLQERVNSFSINDWSNTTKRYLKYHGLEVGEKSAMTFYKDLSNKEYKDLDFVKDA